MRAFITGIGGFVGPHLVAHLRAAGDEVCGSSLRGDPSGGEAATATKRPSETSNVGPWEWDIRRPARDDLFARLRDFAPDVIYHLAALSVPADCGGERPTGEALAVNVGGVENALDLAARLPSRPRLVFISTSHVYAPVAPERAVVSEAAEVGPTTAYGRTKWFGEQAVRRAVEAGRVDAVIARAFKHSGPGQSPRFILPEWASQFARHDTAPIVVQCLDSHFDLCDVRDVVRAYRLLAERGRTGMVYNVGGGVELRSGDLFELLRKFAGSDREARELRPGRRHEPIAAIERLTTDTGWTPHIAIEQTVRDVWLDWCDQSGRRS